MQSGVVNLYRDSQLDIETLHGYFVGQAFSRHMHDYYVIGLIHKGLQTFRYRGNTRYVTPPVKRQTKKALSIMHYTPG